MNASFTNLPLSLCWFDRTVWRIIGFVPVGKSGLARLAEQEEDQAVGRKLLARLGPEPIASPEADFSDAVLHWPLHAAHWMASRFSDGLRYGLLYAALERETALAETAHYYRRFLKDAGIPFTKAPRQHRGVFTFRVDELLADTRKAAKRQRNLSADDHAWCRDFGGYLADHVQSGWLYRSARRENGGAIVLLRASHAYDVAWVETVELDDLGVSEGRGNGVEIEP